MYINRIKIPPKNKRNNIIEGKESILSLTMILNRLIVCRTNKILKDNGVDINGIRISIK
jgi:hypothetical protein